MHTLFHCLSNTVYVEIFSDPSFECPSNIENHSNSSTIMIVNYKWLLIPHITYGCAIFLVIVTALEFIVAQSPRMYYTVLHLSTMLYHIQM